MNYASHSIEVAVVKCRARYECDVPGNGSSVVDAALARTSALSSPGWPAWPLIQARSMRRFVWVSNLKGVAR